MNCLDMIAFYLDKQEHYPISDKFIETCQQKRGGYIQYALETGRPVDANRHEPNQKWHFLESYCLTKVCEKNSIDFQIKGFHCPELLLWLAEAAGVEEAHINEAAGYAAEEIDRIREETPTKSYSAAAVKYMDDAFKKNHNQTLWAMTVSKIEEIQAKKGA